MSNAAGATQQDTTVIPLPPSTGPAGPAAAPGTPLPPAYATAGNGYPAGGYPAAPPTTDPAAAHWYAQFRKQRRRARVLGLTTAVLALATVILVGTSWALFRANDLGAKVAAAVPGISGVIGDPQATPGAASESPAPGTGQDQALAGDLAELQQLAQGLKNDDGSLNPLAVAGLAGKLGTLAQDPQRLNSLIDQAEQQGIIDSQVAGLLRGLLAGAGTSAGDAGQPSAG